MHTEPRYYAIVLASEAIGGIIGAILCDKLKLKMIENNVALFLFLTGVFVFLLGAMYNFSIILIALFAIGVGLFLTMFNVMFVSYIQKTVNEEYIGRIFSFIFTFAILMMPFGNILYTFIITYIKTYALLSVGVGVCISSTLYYIISNKSKKIENSKTSTTINEKLG